MKIQILSDLHFEGGIPPEFKNFQPVGDVLVLAGDITSRKRIGITGEVFGNLSIPVIYVLGNHEYYGGNMDTCLEDYRQWYKDFKQFYVLDNESIQIDNVRFYGSTYWSAVRPSEELDVSRMITDFYVVNGNDIGTHNKRALDAKYFVKDFAQKARAEGVEKTVVITHFAPSYQAREDRFRDSALGSYFYNDDDAIVELVDPTMWIYGHTHGNLRFNVGSVPVTTNQRGYVRGSYGKFQAEPCYADYDMNYVVEI